jgi:hypothetical protein
MEPELWDPDRRRLTLLLDPGRIKRGLAPHEEAGYPLAEGVPVVISIDAGFRDGAGRPLRAGSERRYDVGPAVRSRIDPRGWTCVHPTVGSKEPLTVAFDRPLDHAMLGHCLSVVDMAEGALHGRGSTGAEERSWIFEPDSTWRDVRYQLVVDPRLEDLAGNSLVRVFDRDLTRAEDAPSESRRIAIDLV